MYCIVWGRQICVVSCSWGVVCGECGVLSMPGAGAGVRDTWQFTSSSMHCIPQIEQCTTVQRVEARPDSTQMELPLPSLT